MNWRYLLFAVLIISSCGKTPKPVERTAERIVIKYVSFSIETVFSIGCDNYDQHFNEVKKEIEITSPQEISGLVKQIKKLKDDPERYMPDVRCKIEIYYNDKYRDVICMSYLGVLVNGIPKKMTDEFRNAVMKHTAQ